MHKENYDYFTGTKGYNYFVYTNEEVVSDQRSVFIYMIKKISSNILAFQNVMNASMPIYIYEERSNLERFQNDQLSVPLFVEKVMKTTDPLEKIKQVN